MRMIQNYFAVALLFCALALLAPPQAVYACNKGPIINLNTASAADLDKLAYITASKAAQIIGFRPICDPHELAGGASGTGPKKLSGITNYRLDVQKIWGDNLCQVIATHGSCPTTSSSTGAAAAASSTGAAAVSSSAAVPASSTGPMGSGSGSGSGTGTGGGIVYPRCDKGPVIDLNLASATQLDTLPYVSASAASAIIAARPICDVYELTRAPKKISGITTLRVDKNWGCRAYAQCGGTTTPTCSDGKRNGDEADVDCGGSCPSGCGLNKLCAIDIDCGTGLVCNTTLPIGQATCINAPTCSDGIQNGNETGVDCGPAPCSACPATCSDQKQNGAETGVDCGGPCAPCPSLPFSIDLTATAAAMKASGMGGEHTTNFRDVPSDTFIVRRGAIAPIVLAGIATPAEVETPISILWSPTKVSEDDTTIASEKGTSISGWTVGESWYNQIGKQRLLTINIPATAAIGEYSVTISRLTSFRAPRTFRLIVLANPWSSSDPSRTSQTDEYVDAEDGLIWQGLSDDNAATYWRYEQFRFVNLQVALNSLRRLPRARRSDMVWISRHLSYVVGNDICYGKWGTGSYTTGRPAGGYYCSSTKQNCRDPTFWTSSTQVIDLHLAENRPAQYCQCWVFAAVTATLGRALGIPTRVVTTFQSAHDTNKNRAIEKFYELKEGAWEPVEGQSGDSIWSFHVWNEMYFRRTDLDASSFYRYGWQAVDATPQELSVGASPPGVPTDGAYMMGPVSVKLTKRNIDTVCVGEQPTDNSGARANFGCWDGEFVISEVNSNINLWVKDQGQTDFKLYDAFVSDPWGDDFGTIGTQIVTKRPGVISEKCLDPNVNNCVQELLDVTSQYKYAEPSGPGKPSTKAAAKAGDTWSPARRLLAFGDGSVTGPGVMFKLNIPEGLVLADATNQQTGTTANLTIIASTPSDGSNTAYPAGYQINCLFRATALSYAGDVIKILSTVRKNVTLGSKQPSAASCSFSVGWAELEPAMKDSLDQSQRGSILRMTVSARVIDAATGRAIGQFVRERERSLCKPKYMLRSGAVCEGGGRWRPAGWTPTYNCAALDGHITKGTEVIAVYAGDGYCDGFGDYDATFSDPADPLLAIYVNNNVAGCYDGGDCCASTCKDGKYKCGVNGYNCKDPWGLLQEADVQVREQRAQVTAQVVEEAEEMKALATEAEQAFAQQQAAVNATFLAALSALNNSLVQTQVELTETQTQSNNTEQTLENEKATLQNQLRDAQDRLAAALAGSNANKVCTNESAGDIGMLIGSGIGGGILLSAVFYSIWKKCIKPVLFKPVKIPIRRLASSRDLEMEDVGKISRNPVAGLQAAGY